MSERERTIIQIAAACRNTCDALYALCDDGTVWEYNYSEALTGMKETWIPINSRPGER